MSDIDYKPQMDKIIELQNKSFAQYFSYLRTITPIATGMLGLLVALKPDHIQNKIALYLFLISILLLGIGILASALTQFYEVTFLRQSHLAEKSMLKELLDNKDSKKGVHRELPKPIIYTISELVTFSCLSLAIISLIAYVFFVELDIKPIK